MIKNSIEWSIPPTESKIYSIDSKKDSIEYMFHSIESFGD